MGIESMRILMPRIRMMRSSSLLSTKQKVSAGGLVGLGDDNDKDDSAEE